MWSDSSFQGILAMRSVKWNPFFVLHEDPASMILINVNLNTSVDCLTSYETPGSKEILYIENNGITLSTHQHSDHQSASGDSQLEQSQERNGAHKCRSKTETTVALESEMEESYMAVEFVCNHKVWETGMTNNHLEREAETI